VVRHGHVHSCTLWQQVQAAQVPRACESALNGLWVWVWVRAEKAGHLQALLEPMGRSVKGFYGGTNSNTIIAADTGGAQLPAATGVLLAICLCAVLQRLPSCHCANTCSHKALFHHSTLVRRCYQCIFVSRNDHHSTNQSIACMRIVQCRAC
jgi:hypothetical protein